MLLDLPWAGTDDGPCASTQLSLVVRPSFSPSSPSSSGSFLLSLGASTSTAFSFSSLLRALLPHPTFPQAALPTSPLDRVLPAPFARSKIFPAGDVTTAGFIHDSEPTEASARLRSPSPLIVRPPTYPSSPSTRPAQSQRAFAPIDSIGPCVGWPHLRRATWLC